MTSMIRRQAGIKTLAAVAAAAVVLMVISAGSAGAAGRPAPAAAPGAASCAGPQLSATDVPPIGAPVQTIDQRSGAVLINGTAYVPSGPGSLVHLVIIDRCSLSVQAFGFGDHDDGLHQIKAELDKLDRGSLLRYLVILAAPSGFGLTQAGNAYLNDQILRFIGAPPLSIDQSAAPLSVAGVPGSPAGSAFRNYGGDFRGSEGSMTGYLRLDPATERYDFVFSDYVPFSTQATAVKPGQNTITVGQSSFTQSLPAGSTAGFQVLSLNAITLRPSGTNADEAFATNTGNPATSLAAQQRLGSALKKLADEKHLLVLMQSIGNPGGAERTPAWAQIGAAVADLGGTAGVFNALDGGGYALAGGGGLSLPAAEASQQLSGRPGRLTGLLARGLGSQFQPLLADPVSPVNDALIQLVYQAPKSFPPFSTPAEQAAETYLGIQVKLCATTATSCDVRAKYYQAYRANWPGIQTDLSKPDLCPDGPGFTIAVCQAVRGQLYREVSDVTRVRNYLTELQRPFGEAKEEALVNLSKIDEAIQKAVAPPPASNTASQVFQVLSYIVKLGSLAGPEVAAVTSAISAVFSLVAYFTSSGGEPNLLGPKVTAKVNELGDLVRARYRAASSQLDTVGLIVVSDYGKLTDMAGKVDSDKDWMLPPSIFPAVDQMSTAAKQWFYQTLLPVVYFEVQVNPAPPSGPANARDYTCFSSLRRPGSRTSRPFGNEPDSGQVRIITGFAPNGTPTAPVYALASDLGTNPFRVPPASLIDPLFRGPDDPLGPGLGLRKLELYAPRYFSFGRTVTNDARCPFG